MPSVEAGRLLRRREHPRRASYMELFFDLVFIFALAQLTARLVHDLSVTGAVRTFLLLAAVWWVWTVTAWSTDWFSPDAPFVRGLLSWVMFGSLLMAASVPQAFGRYGLLFAGVYLAIHLGRGGGLIYALRGHPAQVRSARVAIWFSATGVLWIAGGVVRSWREPLWAVAIVVDAVIGLFGYPVPLLGHSTQEDLRVIGEHFAERYEQFFIVAIGELILVTGTAVLSSGFGWPHVVALALSFATALLYTRIYHLPAGAGLSAALDRSHNPARVGLAAGYLHLVLLAGILATAAGYELTILQPHWSVSAAPAVTLTAGAVLFLLSRILMSPLTGDPLSWSRIVGLVAILASAPVATHTYPVVTAAIVDVVLLGVTLADNRIRRAPAKRPVSPAARA
jgi:low temperature requirement protein LtrA